MSSYISPLLIKPVVSGISAMLLDKYLLKIESTTRNAYFGASVAVGTALGDYVGTFAPAILPDTQLFAGKTISTRLTEILVGSGTAYSVNRFILSNDFTPSQMGQKLGVVALSQLIGEYASDYFGSQPLSYLI
jgi:hypothetical protein